MQVRFHRNIAASSLADDCNVPQRLPAIIRSFTSIQMVHTHTRKFVTYNFVKHKTLSQSHTLTHAQLCHTTVSQTTW